MKPGGRKISLMDEIADVISDALPDNDENKSFLDSKDFNSMLSSIEDTVKEHIEYNIEALEEEVTR